ncbi:MAG: YkvA family protein [Elusimicrobiota bacterium]|nr:YkvA family protein [Elusimicrobiota bacterium]
MLNALQGQLKLMAADPKDPFAAIIRKLAGPRDAAGYEQPLRALILAMPAMAGQVRAWMTESKFASPISRLHGFAMSYLYSPEDFLPESSMGFFGYLDDAYLIARVYHRTVLEADFFGNKRFSENETLPGDVHNWIKLARELIPVETAAIDSMLEEVFLKRYGNYSALISRAARAGSRSCRPAENEREVRENN